MITYAEKYTTPRHIIVPQCARVLIQNVREKNIRYPREQAESDCRKQAGSKTGKQAGRKTLKSRWRSGREAA